MGIFGKKYKCNVCGAKFDSEQKLADHNKSHAAEPLTVPQ